MTHTTRTFGWVFVFLRHASLAICVAMTGACASTEPKPLPRFDTIAVMADENDRLTLDETTRIEATRSQSADGFKAGTALAIEGSAQCGIAILICLPAGVLIGGVLGASIGGITGVSPTPRTP